MRRISILGWPLGVVCVMTAATQVRAESDLKVAAEVRWRPESERVLVQPGGKVRNEAQQFLRTRVTADFAADGTTRARVQLQDSRTFGVPQSGNIASDDNLGIQQAYFEIGEFFSPALVLRAGRFELNYGNQRLIGGVGWSNAGRTFDAARLTIVQPVWELDIFGAKRVDRQTGPNDDTNFYGAYMRFVEANADVFILLDYDGRTVGPNDDRVLQRWTAGAYSARKLGDSLDYSANAAFQFGDRDSLGVAAYLVAGELGYTTSGETRVRLAGGVDLASGDNDTADSDLNNFNNLYYTGHKFRGFMDQFLASNRQGLLDLYGRADLHPNAVWLLRGDFHFFQTAEDFVSQIDGQGTKNAGFEIDVKARTTQLENAAFEFGGSAFFPSEDWAGPDNDAELWGYLQVTVRLP